MEKDIPPQHPSRTPRSLNRDLFRVALVALAYFLAVRFGLMLVTEPEGLSVIWPASGIGLAALLLSPRRQWYMILAGIFLVNLVSNMVSGTAPAIAIGFSIANTAEPALGGWLMVQMLGQPITFTHLREILVLLLVATLANGVTAAAGALVVALGYGTPFGVGWLTWWVLDAVGILVVTPLIVTWAVSGLVLREILTLQRLELALWMAVACSAAWLIFGAGNLHIDPIPSPYMLFPILMGVALRFSTRTSATAIVLVSIIALGSTAYGVGVVPLGGASPRNQLIAIQAYFCVASVTTMALSTTFTERKKAEQEVLVYRDHLEDLVRERTVELQIANANLEALGRVKDEFVSNVSHELRTPITSMKLRHRLIRQNPLKLEHHLEVIERDTDRLHHTVEDLLTLSRLDQKRTKLALKPVNVNTLVSRYTADRTAVAEAKELKLEYLGSDSLPGITADEGLIEEVLGILLTNAIDYTPSGGGITVSTAMQESDSRRWVGFSVADTGPGIPPDEQAHLFERFFRGKGATRSGAAGTGLGLAIAKEIVDRHGGHIDVESKGTPGEGTRITVWLPERTE